MHQIAKFRIYNFKIFAGVLPANSLYRSGRPPPEPTIPAPRTTYGASRFRPSGGRCAGDCSDANSCPLLQISGYATVVAPPICESPVLPMTVPPRTPFTRFYLFIYFDNINHSIAHRLNRGDVVTEQPRAKSLSRRRKKHTK